MTPYIPAKTIRKMARLGVSEAQVLDVFNNGESKILSSGAKAMIKKFSGYEVGLLYVRGKTGEYLITTVWKRERR